MKVAKSVSETKDKVQGCGCASTCMYRFRFGIGMLLDPGL